MSKTIYTKLSPCLWSNSKMNLIVITNQTIKRLYLRVYYSMICFLAHEKSS